MTDSRNKPHQSAHFDPWLSHRFALAVLADPGREEANGSDLAGPIDADWLIAQGLGAMWCERLGESAASFLSEKDQARLRDADRGARALFMAQTAAVRELDAAFCAEGIEYALMKGVAWRDDIYARPHVRIASDVDVLIDQSSLGKARATLETLGYRLHPKVDSAHEEPWTRGAIDIDLHWQVLAPGRIGPEMTRALLDRRVHNSQCIWRLSDEDMIAVLLMHTAIAKYVCCDHSTLNRVVDFLNATRMRNLDWNRIGEIVQQSGLSGAAWATMAWIDTLWVDVAADRSSRFPGTFQARIHPSQWRSQYLTTWVRRNWPGRLEPGFPWLVQCAFTLPMHDSPGAAWQAIRGRLGRFTP